MSNGQRISPDAPLEGPVREIEPELDEPEHIHVVPYDFEPDTEPAFHLEPLSGPTEASDETPPLLGPEE
jgi:hypothetical protein